MNNLIACITIAAGTSQYPESQSRYAEALLNGVNSLEHGDLQAARAHFALAGKFAPESPVRLAYSALTAAMMGDPQTALSLARDAVRHGYPISDLAAFGTLNFTNELDWWRERDWLALLDLDSREFTGIGVDFISPGSVGSNQSTGDLKEGIGSQAPSPNRPTGVHIDADGNDIYYWWEEGWRRYSLREARGRRPDGDYETGGRSIWWKPRSDLPEPAVLAALRATAPIVGDSEEVPYVKCPSNGAWIVMQEVSHFSKGGGTSDICCVVSPDGKNKIASLAKWYEPSGPISLWPPYFNPDASVMALTGWWKSPIYVFRTSDWSLIWEKPPVLGPCSGGAILSMPNETRLYTSDHSGRISSLARVYDLATGEVLYRGEQMGLGAISGSRDNRIVAGELAQPCRHIPLLEGLTFQPLAEIWLEIGGSCITGEVMVAVDGTMSALPGFSAMVRIGESVFQIEDYTVLSPWLLDPLHIRTIRDDCKLEARSVPLSVVQSMLR